jgi:hypothetical protein
MDPMESEWRRDSSSEREFRRLARAIESTANNENVRLSPKRRGQLMDAAKMLRDQADFLVRVWD